MHRCVKDTHTWACINSTLGKLQNVLNEFISCCSATWSNTMLPDITNCPPPNTNTNIMIKRTSPFLNAALIPPCLITGIFSPVLLERGAPKNEVSDFWLAMIFAVWAINGYWLVFYFGASKGEEVICKEILNPTSHQTKHFGAQLSVKMIKIHVSSNKEKNLERGCL